LASLCPCWYTVRSWRFGRKPRANRFQNRKPSRVWQYPISWNDSEGRHHRAFW
jgi:hypothetical protein